MNWDKVRWQARPGRVTSLEFHEGLQPSDAYEREAFGGYLVCAMPGASPWLVSKIAMLPDIVRDLKSLHRHLRESALKQGWSSTSNYVFERIDAILEGLEK